MAPASPMLGHSQKPPKIGPGAIAKAVFPFMNIHKRCVSGPFRSPFLALVSPHGGLVLSLVLGLLAHELVQ